MSEEQAGFRAGRSINEQIFNSRIIQEKYTEYQKPLYHIFIDFKKCGIQWKDSISMSDSYK